MRRDSVTTALSDLLAGSQDGCIGEPVDPVDLAEYLDDELDPSRCGELEEHLAACAACRAWATEAGLEIPPRAESRGTSRERPWRWLAAAAVLAVAVLAGLGVTRWQAARSVSQLATFGVNPTAWHQADAGHQARLRQALEAEVAEVAYFSDFLDGQERSALRAASLSHGPRPVAPRWSALRSTRPIFRWYPGATGTDGGSRGDILVVDDHETVVATLDYAFEAADPGTSQALPWPAELPDLEPGRTYAWKVNAVVDGEWQASEYVPFTVLLADVVEQRLAQVAGNAFQTGVELAALGLYQEALASLAEVDRNEHTQAVLERLVQTILARQRIPDDLVHTELQRWLASAG